MWIFKLVIHMHWWVEPLAGDKRQESRRVIRLKCMTTSYHWTCLLLGLLWHSSLRVSNSMEQYHGPAPNNDGNTWTTTHPRFNPMMRGLILVQVWHDHDEWVMGSAWNKIRKRRECSCLLKFWQKETLRFPYEQYSSPSSLPSGFSRLHDKCQNRQNPLRALCVGSGGRSPPHFCFRRRRRSGRKFNSLPAILFWRACPHPRSTPPAWVEDRQTNLMLRLGIVSVRRLKIRMGGGTLRWIEWDRMLTTEWIWMRLDIVGYRSMAVTKHIAKESCVYNSEISKFSFCRLKFGMGGGTQRWIECLSNEWD